MYREPDQALRKEADERAAAEASLAQVAAQGNARSDAAAALATDHERLLVAAYELGILTWIGSVAAWAVALAGWAAGAALVNGGAANGWASGAVGVAWSVAVYFGYGRVWRAVARARLARDRVMLEGVGFPVDGFFERATSLPNGGRVAFSIELAGPLPAPTILRGVLAQVDAEIDSSANKTVQAHGPDITGPRNKFGVADNSELPAWERSLVLRALVPIHQAHRIKRVVIG